MAPLIELAVALQHRVVPVRCLVIHATRREPGATTRENEAAHAGESRMRRDVFVARDAEGGVGVVGAPVGEEETLRSV